MPNGASRRIRPASQTLPPCGAMASPHTVTISDRALGGAVLSSVRIQRATHGSGPVPGLATRVRAFKRDTELAATIKKVYRFCSPAASPGAEEVVDVRTDGRHGGQEAPHARGNESRGARVPGAHRRGRKDRAQG